MPRPERKSSNRLVPRTASRMMSSFHRSPDHLERAVSERVGDAARRCDDWTLGRIDQGSVVLDLGRGAGTDLLIAARMTGPTGRVIGRRHDPVDAPTRARQRAGMGWRAGSRMRR